MTKKMYIRVESMTDSDKLIAIKQTVESLKKAIYQICEISQEDTTAIFSTFDDFITIDDDDDDDESESETIDDDNAGFVSHSLGIKEENELKVGQLVRYNFMSYDRADNKSGVVVSWSVIDSLIYVINSNDKKCTLEAIRFGDLICHKNEISYLGLNPTDGETSKKLFGILRNRFSKMEFVNSTGFFKIKNGNLNDDKIIEIMEQFDFVKQKNKEFKVGKIIKFTHKEKTVRGIVVCWSFYPDYIYVLAMPTEKVGPNLNRQFCGLIRIKFEDLVGETKFDFDQIDEPNPTDNATARKLVFVLRSYCYKMEFFNFTDDFDTVNTYPILDGKFTNYTIVNIMRAFGFRTSRGGQWSNAIVSFYYGETLKKLGSE
jgi:hypothetical protein